MRQTLRAIIEELKGILFPGRNHKEALRVIREYREALIAAKMALERREGTGESKLGS